MIAKQNPLLGCRVLVATLVTVLLLVVCVGRGYPASARAESPLRSPPPVPAQRPSTGSSGQCVPDQRTFQPNPAFPRLGMWWPDPYEQPLDEIARYDWLILGDWASEFIAPLRGLNPAIILLNDTNACELSFNPDPDAEPWENAQVLAVPPEWFLTQVGSTLVDAVDAATTTFRVAEVTESDGTADYDLFMVGDAVLIEGETVYVEAVDTANRLLTVQRGYVRPAEPHAAGTRLAAHITFWPGSWLLNVSTICPEAAVSETIGSEIWADYNARVAVDLVNNAPWDGILLDRSDPDQSWLIGNSTARTIDPDQSNTLLTDYTTFDLAWNQGLRRYESALRNAIGPEKIIFANWGMANYDLLNGNNFEGFPADYETITGYGDDYAEYWREMVFGPGRNGSYFDWMEQSLDPNLTMIETYEEDGAPDPWGPGEYDNPCDDPDFVPNYRKMRFGLATALLNDGYFSYEINTNGHGSLCLLWFDEYDNAGEARAYLGQPVGSAFQAIPPLTTPNLLGDSTFEGSMGNWDVWWPEEGYSASVSLDTATSAQGGSSLRVEVTRSAGVDWAVSAYVSPVEVVSGTQYTLSFWAKADSEKEIPAWVQQEEDPWRDYLWFGSVPLTTAWQRYEFSGVASGDDSAAGFYFGLGETTGTVWLDDVRLQVGSRQVWRRDYQGGLVLVNATASSLTLPLGAPFRKIEGTQVPEINDGSTVTEVTLPPWDGMILLRSEHWHGFLLPLVWKG
ncbi:MAG: carbohydrate binding domain-containing protein [Anaerolineae bacterium]|nr:carbohydrate binding domain-containing protein [Anaerolineae bacterium]